MAFRGTDNSQMFQLAMMLMDRKRQAQLDRESSQQSQIKAMQDFQKFRRDIEKSDLEIAAKRAELGASMRDESAGLAPLADAASAPVPDSVMRLPVDERQRALAPQQAAADSFIQGLNRVGVTRQNVLGEAPREAATQAGIGANPTVRDARATARRSDDVARESRAEATQIRSEERAEARRQDREASARANGFWEKNSLISHKNDEEKKFAGTNIVNEGWNALEKLKSDSTAQQYLEIVQRWVRMVDEGATVREGDIDLVQYFGMSGVEELKAWAAGTADAEAKVPKKAKEAISQAFGQILTERDRTVREAWLDSVDYADRQNWNEGERATAMPPSRAVRRVFQRSLERSTEAVAIPDGFATPEANAEANRRVMRRFGLKSRDQVNPAEAFLELKAMYLESAGGAR